MKARVSGKTAATDGSSRTHLANAFNYQVSNALYGVVLDVAGCEKTAWGDVAVCEKEAIE